MAKSRRAVPGQPLVIPAEDWNDLMDLKDARPWLRGQGGIPRETINTWPYCHRVRIKNTTGNSLPMGSVVGLGDNTMLPGEDLTSFRRTPVLEASIADPALHWAKWAVVIQNCANNALGWAAINGIVPVKVNIIHAAHDRVQPADAELTHLKSDFAGTGRFLWRESGTGVKWAWVEFHRDESRELKCVADTVIGAGLSGAASVWKSGVDTGANIEVVLDWMHGGQQISTGKQMLAKWFYDELQWIVTGAECETPA